MMRELEGCELPGVQSFSQTLRAAERSPRSRARWDPHAPAIVSRAPGRLDVMGGIADYSGSLVLELPLREATFVALQTDDERNVSLISSSENRRDDEAVVSMPLDGFLRDGEPVTYAEARASFERRPEHAWAAYAAGAFLVLTREKGVSFPHGARLFVHSDVPEGKGVASSAALEVATMVAIDAAYELGLDPRELALLCQKVENLVVGAPCGVMDQMTATLGERDRLLAILCQPAEIHGTFPVPEELAFWGIDSGVAHAVSGADYASVRVGAFMGFRILQEMAGTSWSGYLANVTPSELSQTYLAHLPEWMSGRDFLERYETTNDDATTVDPAATYPVRHPTAHPVEEHFRVRAFSRLLGDNALEAAKLAGELMYQSHASYSSCGLGSEGTDRLVALARAAGPSRGVFGAKITGGGSGGTVAILGRRDAGTAVREIADRYAEETGTRPHVFAGSSPGAIAFGARRFSP